MTNHMPCCCSLPLPCPTQVPELVGGEQPQLFPLDSEQGSIFSITHGELIATLSQVASPEPHEHLLLAAVHQALQTAINK